jgi:hypothetical protein
MADEEQDPPGIPYDPGPIESPLHNERDILTVGRENKRAN